MISETEFSSIGTLVRERKVKVLDTLHGKLPPKRPLHRMGIRIMFKQAYLELALPSGDLAKWIK